MDNMTYQTYLDIIKKELVPSMGCTEPNAIAFCAAKARSVLNQLPERVLIEASGNIIKNVKSVIVPNTKGMKGIEVAAAMGIVAGDDKKGLEVISHVDSQMLEEVKTFMKNVRIEVKNIDSDLPLDIRVTLFSRMMLSVQESSTIIHTSL
jgi:L-cysteine desulfidase